MDGCLLLVLSVVMAFAVSSESSVFPKNKLFILLYNPAGGNLVLHATLNISKCNLALTSLTLTQFSFVLFDLISQIVASVLIAIVAQVLYFTNTNAGNALMMVSDALSRLLASLYWRRFLVLMLWRCRCCTLFPCGVQFLVEGLSVLV